MNGVHVHVWLCGHAEVMGMESDLRRYAGKPEVSIYHF